MQKPATIGHETGRRTFLTYGIFAIGGLITMALGIPLIGSLVLPTLRGRKADFVSAGATSQFTIGQPKQADVKITITDGWSQQTTTKGVWVVRKSESDFVVYNGHCVHLGCAYNWKEDAKEFQCPCHGGRYTIDGAVTGGPPPRPLDTLAWRVDGANLMVEYSDFRQGIPTKEAT